MIRFLVLGYLLFQQKMKIKIEKVRKEFELEFGQGDELKKHV
jgi:hypothetical protein